MIAEQREVENEKIERNIEEIQLTKCPKCGFKLEISGVKFCTECGWKLY